MDNDLWQEQLFPHSLVLTLHHLVNVVSQSTPVSPGHCFKKLKAQLFIKGYEVSFYPSIRYKKSALINFQECLGHQMVQLRAGYGRCWKQLQYNMILCWKQLLNCYLFNME